MGREGAGLAIGDDVLTSVTGGQVLVGEEARAAPLTGQVRDCVGAGHTVLNKGAAFSTGTLIGVGKLTSNTAGLADGG